MNARRWRSRAASGLLPPGDAVTIEPEEISDWMVVRDGVLYGGFTVIVVRRLRSEEERREFDASVDFVIPSSARMLE